jgi:ABC-type polysaccharide/polyol phosphate transport system ATPase subunit
VYSSTFCSVVPAAIELRGVGKCYRQLHEEAGLRSLLPFMGKRHEELWALRDIELTVEPGEIVGVLGHNGAGKTTMLRLLAGVTSPSEGRVRVVGRIAPLISLGVGFHKEMSGRENVLVNGMLLGLTAEQVEERFDSIVDFAELHEFIDTPVKFYSSGMTMRLGFAVVIHIDPTVLLVDEILAVGDASFQLKCFNRLREFQRQGAAIVMVSHALHTVRQLCPRAVLIRHGELIYDGDVERAIALHYASVSELAAPGGDGMSIEVVEQQLVGGEGEDHHANYDQPMELKLRLRFHRDVEDAHARFSLRTEGGNPVASHTAALQPSSARYRKGEELAVRIGFRARLGGANYRLAVELHDGAGDLLGVCEGPVVFVAGRPGSVGVIDLRAEIEVDGVDRTDRRLTLLGT